MTKKGWCERELSFHAFRLTKALISSPIVQVDRLTIENSGRYVPVGVAENRMYSHALGLDDYRGTDVPANLGTELAPFTDIAGVGRGPNAMSMDTYCTNSFKESSLSIGNRKHPRGLYEPGNMMSERAGGRLQSLARNYSIFPSPKIKPVKRCVKKWWRR